LFEPRETDEKAHPFRAAKAAGSISLNVKTGRVNASSIAELRKGLFLSPRSGERGEIGREREQWFEVYLPRAAW